jgi:hypothetical protein
MRFGHPKNRIQVLGIQANFDEPEIEDSTNGDLGKWWTQESSDSTQVSPLKTLFVKQMIYVQF